MITIPAEEVAIAKAEVVLQEFVRILKKKYKLMVMLIMLLADDEDEYPKKVNKS